MFKKITLGLLMIAVLSSALASPAEARRFRRGRGGFGLAAGLIGAGIASSAFNRGYYGGYGGYGYSPYAYGGYPYGGYGYSPYAVRAAPYGSYGAGFAPYGGYPYYRRRRRSVLPFILGAAAIAAIASGR